MSGTDPFGLYDDDRTTIIRPQPGGRGPARPGTGAPPPPDRSALSSIDAGEGPLIAALRGLLSLAPELNAHTPPTDATELRRRVEAELKRFEDLAYRSGLDARTVRVAHYIVCALIDDVVLNTPWGGHSSWPGQTLCATIHRDVTYGERFFDLLEELKRRPEQNRELLQLMYLCLTLGFEGKFRQQVGSSAALADLREELYRLLRRHEGRPEAEFSPDWRGVSEPHRPLDVDVPLWVVGVAALALLALVYTGFSLRLAGYTDRIKPLLATLPPQEQVVLDRAAPPPPAPRFVERIKERVDAFLADEIAAGLVATFEDADSVTARLRGVNGELFASGKAQLNERYRPVVRRVAAALAAEEGAILVVGHSDNVPIRRPPFFNNWQLSEARAETVAKLLASDGLIQPARIDFVGRADTEPVASNDTPTGRAANRRIEIVLSK